MASAHMSNADRLKLAELTSAVDQAKQELDRARHGALYNRLVVDRATARLAEHENRRAEFLACFPGRLG